MHAGFRRRTLKVSLKEAAVLPVGIIFSVPNPPDRALRFLPVSQGFALLVALLRLSTQCLETSQRASWRLSARRRLREISERICVANELDIRLISL